MKYAEYVISGWVVVTVSIGLYLGQQQRALRAIKRMDENTALREEPSDG